MKNDWTIQDYQLVKQPKKINCLPIIFLASFIVGILLILYKFNFQVYEKYVLIKNENQYLIMVESKKISALESNSDIYIQNQKYKYQIINISSDYSNINGVIYQTVSINLYNYKTDAIVSDCYLLKSNKTILEMIIKFMKGGIE